MTRKQHFATWTTVACIGAAIAAVIIQRSGRQNVKSLIGCVVRDDPDPRKQVPVANAEIKAPDDVAAANTHTDASGLFRLNLRPGVEKGQTILLRLGQSEYEPLNIYENAEDKLYVIRMTPLPRPAAPIPDGPEVAVGNVRVRYALTSTTTLNVGSAGKSFEVVNMGNVPCEHGGTCSPDGKWKAVIGGTSLDASEGNEFQDARLTCIAGPCPFTKVEQDNFSGGGRTISARVRVWSDTVSFLLEAQVVHSMSGDMVRQSYPVKIGPGMDFTLPPIAQGLSIEAEISGVDVVYPLGPSLAVSWATCTVSVDSDRAKRYHCDLKAGYRFQ
jgi:hypothetical protein